MELRNLLESLELAQHGPHQHGNSQELFIFRWFHIYNVSVLDLPTSIIGAVRGSATLPTRLSTICLTPLYCFLGFNLLFCFFFTWLYVFYVCYCIILLYFQLTVLILDYLYSTLFLFSILYYIIYSVLSLSFPICIIIIMFTLSIPVFMPILCFFCEAICAAFIIYKLYKVSCYH